MSDQVAHLPGDPPIPEVVARLLRERWGIDARRLEVETLPDGLGVSIDEGRSVFGIRVRYRSGAPDGDPWMLCADALDALVGTLVENDWGHRELPAGEGVAFGGALFAVDVTRSVPELQKVADRILEDN